MFYVASHSHYCSTSGGFPEETPRIMWHSTAWTKAPAGVNTPALTATPTTPARRVPDPAVDAALEGRHLHRAAGSDPDGDRQRSYVLYGGEFLAVNGVAQQGIARFAVRSLAPNKSGPKAPLGEGFVPTAQADLPGAVQVSWPAAWDADDLTLTYRLLRNGTQISETPQAAYEWMGTDMTYVDAGLTAGQQGLVRRPSDRPRRQHAQLEHGVDDSRRRRATRNPGPAGHAPCRQGACRQAAIDPEQGSQAPWHAGSSAVRPSLITHCVA